MIRTWLKTKQRRSLARRKGTETSKTLQSRTLQSEMLERRLLLAADTPWISEFMASNDQAYVDQFGLSRDWIEIFNPTPDPIPLANWHLTDDKDALDKWTFPDVILQPSEFMVVFASGLDIKDTAEPFHTNFRVSADGEYLALVKPDMTVAHDFGESFPKQFADVSFGLGATPGAATADDSTFTYHVPTSADAALGSSWADIGFDDSAWQTSQAPLSQGIGYAISRSAEDFAGLIATDTANQMLLVNSSLWIRQEFEVADASEVDGLLLDLYWDDGYALFLNGQQIRDVNLPESGLTWNAEAEVPRRPRRRNSLVVETPDELDLGQHTNLIVDGTNVLAIHALNDNFVDSELFIKASATTISMPTDLDTATVGYISEATPGSANRPLQGGSVDISVESQIFTEAFTVELSTSFAGQTIRYTTDGTDPTIDSPEYTQPIEVSGSMQIRTTAFASTGASGPISKRTYTVMSDDIKAFSSNLPLMVFSTEIDQLRRVAKNRPVGSHITLFEPGEDGRTRVTSEPVVKTNAALDRRGSSTSGNPKLNMAVELQTESGADNDVAWLGMPADSDWVFYAPYNFDRTKGARNSFFFEISNQIGPWASRTRFVELFHVVNGADLTVADYQGIYVIIEKIQRDEHKVDIEKLSPEDNTEPDVTGGWIFKIDRSDMGDSGFRGGRQSILNVNPKEDEVTPEQEEWISNFFDNMSDVFRNPDSTWEQITDIIDVDSWIDHAIINTVTFNLDAYRLSGYFFMDREGKLEMGPVWDCDRCMDSEDGRDNDPEVWHSRVPDFGTDFFGYPWWVDLYANQPNFWQAWIDRWSELREEVLSDANMLSIVEFFTSQLVEAHPRDTETWPANRPNGGPFDPNSSPTWESEVIHLKNWILARAKWMDERFVAPVEMTPDSGQLLAGQEITMSAAAGTIYYTTDGTDPRASGGSVAPGALTYTGPITVDSSAAIVARAFDDSEPVELNPGREHDDPRSGSFWSAPATVSYAAESIATQSNLRITEVHYNPHDATQSELQKLGEDAVQNGVDNDEFEFLEVMNISDAPIILEDVELARVQAFDRSNGVDFKFAAQTLDPGQRIVVVENADAFRARYGDGVRIASGSTGAEGAVDGQYGGNLENLGETLKLVDRFGNLIQRFTYDDKGLWPERADGLGSSLELIDVNGDSADPANWMASSLFGGNPGTVGSGAQGERVVVTEVLANSVAPQGDMLELHNPTGSPVDITNWFLSNSDSDLFKFQVTTPTTIPAGGYAVFTEQQLGFGFDGALGGKVLVVEADSSGQPIRFAHESRFGNALEGVSLGRWPDSRGDFLPMVQSTFGASNSSVRAGDVIISEIHYAPLDPDGPGRERADNFEFVELFNQTGSDIDLGGWHVGGDNVDFTFEAGTVLGSGEALVLLQRTDPSNAAAATVFRFLLNVPNSTQLIGPVRSDRRATLDDEGANVLLERPGSVSEVDPNITSMVVVDTVTYENVIPWPQDINGTGNSLTRVSAQEPGFLPISWTAAAASPGTAEFTVRVAGDANEDGQFDEDDIVLVLQGGKYLTGQPASWDEGDWNGDGVFDPKDIVVALQAGTYLANAMPVVSASAVAGRFGFPSAPVPQPADAVFARLVEFDEAAVALTPASDPEVQAEMLSDDYAMSKPDDETDLSELPKLVDDVMEEREPFTLLVI